MPRKTPNLKTSKKKKKTTKKPISTSKAASSDLLPSGVGEVASALAIGHQPTHTLTPQDDALFRAFQSNLLSLISHELRTPLMGVLNALTLMEEGSSAGGGLDANSLISMARRNAHQLQYALSSLLDLAGIESGTFHVRLREVVLERLVSETIQECEATFREKNLQVAVENAGGALGPALADPQKLGRAIELCLQSMLQRTDSGSTMQVRISTARIDFFFNLAPGAEQTWSQAWSQALAGYQGGVTSPTSAFAGTVQTEQDFLSRKEEGLGSEYLLVHEIMRLHRGQFSARLETSKETRLSTVVLSLELPTLSSEEGLRMVLASRTAQISFEKGALGSVALGLISVPSEVRVEDFRGQVQKNLFRASDAVYALPKRQQLALVLDDCRPEDAPRLVARISKQLGRELNLGVAASPADGNDADQLIELAEQRLKK